MNYKISEDRKRLTITATADEREELRNWPGDRNLSGHTPDSIGSDEAMHEFLEPLTCNSELRWINPADTGDLTDAPMLAILGDPVPVSLLQTNRCGQVGAGSFGYPVRPHACAGHSQNS